MTAAASQRFDLPGGRDTRGTGRRFRGAIANRLGTAILSGAHPPGATLAGEVESAEALNVSRSAYREALQVLAAKGLVESRPKTGTRVLPRSRWNLLDPDVLAWAFMGDPDVTLVRSLFELRAIIEPAAAGMAAERAEPDDLAAMDAALVAMAKHSLASEAGQQADREFHAAVLRATRNDPLIALSASIGAAVSWTTRFKQRARALPRNPIPDHVAVFERVAAHDPTGAAAAMRTLVELALEDTRLSMSDEAG